MTKLEQKLIELGYKKDFEIHSKKILIFYIKTKWIFARIQIVIDKELNEIWRYQVDIEDKIITYYRQAEEIQLAFNTMQKDLEILRECEK